MSLVSWFQSASTLKRTAVVGFLAVNALTAIDSMAVGNVVSHSMSEMKEEDFQEGETLLKSKGILFALAPIMTAGQWLMVPDKNSPKSKLQNSWPHLPLNALADLSKDNLPRGVHNTIGVGIGLLGAPGSWAGITTGIIATDIIRLVRQPS